MDSAGTRYLVVDYINNRLNNNGVQWDQCPASDTKEKGRRVRREVQTGVSKFNRRTTRNRKYCLSNVL